MPPLIVGSTLSDLGRNSLLAEDARQAGFNDALDRVERRRALANQLALTQDLAAREDARFGADLGLRREVAFAPWQRGMTPLEAERARLEDADIQFKRMNAMLPYQRMTAAQAAETEYRNAMLPAQSALLEGQAKYYSGGGKPAWQIERERMESASEDARLSRAASALAGNANVVMDGELGNVREELVNSLHSFGGWGSGFQRQNAEFIADQIISGKDKVMLGGEDVSGNYYVTQARRKLNALLAPAANHAMQSLGPDAAALIGFDSRSKRFVPMSFGTATVPDAAVAPTQTNAVRPRLQAVRGPDGNFIIR